MTVATFEALATGATTAGAAGFDFMKVPGSGGGVAVVSSPVFRGTRALQLTTGTSGSLTCYMERTTTNFTATATGQLYQRVRFYMPTLPPDTTGVRVLVIADSIGAFIADVRVTSAGAVQLRNSADAVVGTFSTTYAAGTWMDVGLAITTFSATVGVVQAARWDGAGNLVQTVTSPATQDTIRGGGTLKRDVGPYRSVTGFTMVVDDYEDSQSGWPSITSTATVTTGPWSGAVTAAGFTAGYRLSGATSARLVVSTSADLSSPVYGSAVAPDADGMVLLPVTGLTANTQYHYGVEINGVLAANGRGEARTFPAAGAQTSFSIWFGSCQWTQPADSTYAAVLAKSGPYGRALMGVHMGDLNYRDWGAGATAADVFAQHMLSLGSGSMAPNLAKIPLNYMWDNHDWGGDASDSTAAAGPVVAAQYRRVFPTYNLPASNGRGGYHAWTVGRIRFIQLDVRSYRSAQTATDGPSKTMLGAEQVSWLQTELLRSEPAKVICGNYYWRQDSATSGRWGSYATEFQAINAFITANRPAIGGVYVLFGDRHALCGDDGNQTGAYGIPSAGGAPIQQGSVAPGTGERWSAGYWHNAPNTIQGYGWLDITDTGTTIRIDYQGISSLDGVVRTQMTTTFTVAPTDTRLPAVWGVHL
ncbi:MAG TPA: alkaline phosphatase D family protein [Pseudonocardia sp.]